MKILTQLFSRFLPKRPIVSNIGGINLQKISKETQELLGLSLEIRKTQEKLKEHLDDLHQHLNMVSSFQLEHATNQVKFNHDVANFIIDIAQLGKRKYYGIN